ncbi:acyl carrier protein [Actinoplanes sp. CA-051413]|uniref:acyl carrier protein n=1 Tax=Actinoplanes sp. CA-051413 TaxID=3239899 RepID=UPI003D95D4B7
MAQLTMDDVRQILLASAGDDDTDLHGAIDEVAFGDLGYDSLALLEVQSQLQRRYPVKLPDGWPAPGTTPAELLRHVNGLLPVEVSGAGTH